jgi:hypothetical protein
MVVLQRINMASNEIDVHSFIVKLWLEKEAQGTKRVTWHGYITHVPGGERRYLKDMNDVTEFIELHMEQMGVEFGIRGRVRRWLTCVIVYLTG